MGTKPWWGLGAICLGGLFLCGCQSEDKRPWGTASNGMSKPTPGSPQPSFPSTGVPSANNGSLNGTQSAGWNPSAPGLKQPGDPGAFKSNSPASSGLDTRTTVPSSPFATGAGSNPNIGNPSMPSPPSGQFGAGSLPPVDRTGAPVPPGPGSLSIPSAPSPPVPSNFGTNP